MVFEVVPQVDVQDVPEADVVVGLLSAHELVVFSDDVDGRRMWADREGPSDQGEQQSVGAPEVKDEEVGEEDEGEVEELLQVHEGLGHEEGAAGIEHLDQRVEHVLIPDVPHTLQSLPPQGQVWVSVLLSQEVVVVCVVLAEGEGAGYAHRDVAKHCAHFINQNAGVSPQMREVVDEAVAGVVDGAEGKVGEQQEGCPREVLHLEMVTFPQQMRQSPSRITGTMMRMVQGLSTISSLAISGWSLRIIFLRRRCDSAPLTYENSVFISLLFWYICSLVAEGLFSSVRQLTGCRGAEDIMSLIIFNYAILMQYYCTIYAIFLVDGRNQYLSLPSIQYLSTCLSLSVYIQNQPSQSQHLTMIFSLIIFHFLTAISSQCNHPIFCFQPILEAASYSNMFKDSKTFVDLTLSVPIQQALTNFKNYPFRDFIQRSFTEADHVLEPGTLKDHKDNPKPLQKIQDPKLYDFALTLNDIWKDLTKHINLTPKTGTCKDSCTSFLPELDNRTIIIPGGRFREAYYWDTYWIIKGLLVGEMYETVETVLANFMQVLRVYGFVPNGFRLYYLGRSQPPFLWMMVRDFLEALREDGQTERASTLEKQYYPYLEKEHQYWMDTHSLNLSLPPKTFTLNKYTTETKTPRPQSYREDLKTSQNITSKSQKERIYKCISSVAQSGWDFSTRWLYNVERLSSLIIDDMVPTDLNSLMGMWEQWMAKISEHQERKLYYQQLAVGRVEYFMSIRRQGRFPDYFVSGAQKELSSQYPSDYFPYLLLNQKVYLNLSQKINPSTSSLHSGQQWDKPNVWAPLNWLYHEIATPQQAVQLARQWVQTVYCGWKKTGNIYEKYRDDQIGERGEGGEYQVQTGFGWTNGLALYYLGKYGDQLVVSDCL